MSERAGKITEVQQQQEQAKLWHKHTKHIHSSLPDKPEITRTLPLLSFSTQGLRQQGWLLHLSGQPQQGRPRTACTLGQLLPGSGQGREDLGIKTLKSRQNAGPFTRAASWPPRAGVSVSTHMPPRQLSLHTKRLPPSVGAACPATWPPPKPIPHGNLSSPYLLRSKARMPRCARSSPSTTQTRSPSRFWPWSTGLRCPVPVAACYCRLWNGRQNPSCAART